jgi:hypothetical protein
MEEIVLKYLNKNFRVTFSTFDSFLLKDLINGGDVKLSEVMKSIPTIFDVEENDSLHIFDKWCDQQNILLNNRLVEMQEKLYSAGINIELNSEQKNKVSEDWDVESILGSRIKL